MAAERATIREGAPPAQATRAVSNAEFQTAMAHLYRGEIGRANTWRMRLDGTTNWAVLTTAATLSFAFSNANNTQVMILINSLLVFFFLYIEARRYRFYDLWRARTRLLEIEFFAEMLTPSSAHINQSWRALLADDLLHPRFSISMREALGRRLRRNYIWLFGVLAISWVVKITIHPERAASLAILIRRIAIGPIPAWAVLLVGAGFNSMLLWLLVSTRHVAKHEVETLPREETRQRMGTGEDPNQ